MYLSLLSCFQKVLERGNRREPGLGDLSIFVVDLDAGALSSEHLGSHSCGPAAYEGIEEHGIDRVVIDVAEPWRVLPHAAQALRPGGVLLGFVPSVVQVKALVDALRAREEFTAIEVMENLLRFWHVKNLSVRPEHRMVAHTGFIIVARRVKGDLTSAAR